MMVPNQSLKAFASLTGTVQTGAASHYRAGSSCPLARRYMQMMKRIIFLSILLSGCGEENHYKSAKQFKNDVVSWGVLNIKPEESQAILISKGFTCDQKGCFKVLQGFPCSQRLVVDFIISEAGLVTSFTIWEDKLDGIPKQCM
jgi:hypothetical protein